MLIDNPTTEGKLLPMTTPPPSKVTLPPIDFAECATIAEANDRYQQLFTAYDCENDDVAYWKISEAHRLRLVDLTDAEHQTAAREASAEERVAKNAARAEAKGRSAGGKQLVKTASGARVTVADLLAAGVVEAGDVFTWDHKGTHHEAEVTTTGALDVVGTSVTSPSDAAKVANGGGSFNGWKCWSRNGATLADLRAQLSTE